MNFEMTSAWPGATQMAMEMEMVQVANVRSDNEMQRRDSVGPRAPRHHRKVLLEIWGDRV
jgi:hypothetical protein